MHLLADEPVVSGQQYPITDVDGCPPRKLDNFTGDVCLTLIRNDIAVQMMGDGCPVSGSAVRFHQKHPGPDGKDVRVWTITGAPDGSFLATPAAAF